MKLKILTWALLLLTLVAPAFAQDLDSLIAILEARQNQDDDWLSILSGDADYHIFYFQGTWESDSYSSGRDLGYDRYNLTAQATYNYKQFTAGIAGIMYEGAAPLVQTAIATVAYRLPLALPVDIDLGYDRYFFMNESDTLSAQYPNGLTASIGHRSKFWGASVAAGMFAGTGGVIPQVVASGYGNFKLYSWKETNSLQLRPELSFNFGTEDVVLVAASGLGKVMGNGNGQGQGGPPGSDTGTETEDYETLFGLLNTEININLIAYLGDMDLTLTIRNNRPLSLDGETIYSPTSLVCLMAGYTLSFLQK